MAQGPSAASASGIERLTAADIPAAAQLYTRAFAANAVYSGLLFRQLDTATREAARHWLFIKRLHLLLDAGAIILKVVSPTGELLGAVAGVPPGGKPGLLAHIRAGLLGWPLRWGWASFRTVLGIDALMGYCHAHDADWAIAMMAVAPGVQGGGVGRRLLGQLLSDIAAAADAAWVARAGQVAASTPRPPVRVRLDTQAAGNVLFYSKAGGFTLLERRVVDPVKGAVVTLVTLPEGSSSEAACGGAGTTMLVSDTEAQELATAAAEAAADAAAAAASGGLPRYRPVDDAAPFTSWTMARFL